MHELSLAENLIELIEASARREGFSRVKTVWLEIGQLSAVEPEAMGFCFDAAAAGSRAEGARLEIVPIPGRGLCRVCGRAWELAEFPAPCPDCGAYDVKLTAGDQMRVRELEVE